MKLTANEMEKYAVISGRTLVSDGALWINWSCTGLTCRFQGTSLRAKFAVLPNEQKGPMAVPGTWEYPCVGIMADGGEDFVLRQTLKEDGWYDLYSGDAGEHTVGIMKLSENSRGKCGVVELETDGEFLPADLPAEKISIEVVGDSITCGYGNESKTPGGFRTNEENGWAAYGALAAQEIGASYQCVAISGGSVTMPENLPFPGMLPGLEDVYGYADSLLEREKGKTAGDFTPWDFAAHPKDAVVINLGTNDGNMMSFGDPVRALARFREHYNAFIETIRRLNGPDTVILCTLGCMDYYLWDEIKDIVNAYIARTGDQKIFCGKYGKTRMWTEGMGADGHPSVKSHERMGHELAAMLRERLGL